MIPKTLTAVALTASMTWLSSTSQPPPRPSNPAPAQHTDATGRDPGIVPFSSNGCSGFREARFSSCCFVHDLAFWAGGTWSDRNKADLQLWRCVFDISGERVVADIGYILVRLGTLPGWIIGDGWGRAWKMTPRRRYAALTLEQRKVVDDEKKRICESLKLNPRTSLYLVDDRREIRTSQAREICGGDPPARR